MDPESRRRVIDSLALRTFSGWTHFVVMMVLSVGISVMGLSADSAAVVIGAMLLAPLMTPVLGSAASITMALMRSLRRSALVLIVASAGSVALSWLLSMPLRDGPLSQEVIARTSPDGRDLVVALAAGAAGAYATARADLSNSLPGVAIAVALVPPLAAAGMTLEAGRMDLAKGALLLYGTNLAAIIVAGVAVFVLTGFAPPRRLARTSWRVATATVVVSVALVAVAVPLMIASFRAADRARDRQAIERAVAGWLGGSTDQVDDIDLGDSSLDVRVFGLEEPPPAEALEARVRAILGDDAVVTVRWTQAVLVGAEVEPPSDAEKLEAEVLVVVEEWLAPNAASYEVTSVSVGDGVVRISVTSTERPPGVDDLAARLLEALGLRSELEVDWTPRTVLKPGGGQQTALAIQERLSRVASDWVVAHPEVELLEVDFDGEVVTVDLVGTSPPDGKPLEALLRDASEVEDLEVRVWFSLRQAIVPAPTATAAPTPTVAPTPRATPVATSTPGPTGGPDDGATLDATVTPGD